MIIKNKIESIEMIKSLHLNQFPEELFFRGDEERVSSFLKKYPAKYYAVRDKSKSGGVFKLKVEDSKVLDEIKEYDSFTINVSSANYDENQILVGEIEFLSNGEVYLILSSNPKYSVRDALRDPDFNLKTNIFDDILNEIPGFDFIYDYVTKNDLMDVIVEFSLFDIPVGIQNEKIVIYELRTHY